MDKVKKIPIYFYNKETNKWSIAAASTERLPAPSSFKIMTLNVLFDEWWGTPYKPHIVRPLERYQHQFEVMQAADCDIITLNEVTANYVALIIQEKWVQERYFISDINGDSINNFGNLVLSKYPIAGLYLKQVPRLKRPIVCVHILFENCDLLIAASHLSAQKTNHQRRQVQIKELIAYLDTNFKQAEKIILGDVNYHSESEIVPADYMDAWKLVHPDLPGNTFDGTVNTMLHEMWPLAWMYGFEDDIRMRLDRVFIQLTKWQPTEMELCFNHPVYEAKRRSNIIKDLLSVAFDKFGVNIARNPKYYLFPSDHFGLISTFVKIG